MENPDLAAALEQDRERYRKFAARFTVSHMSNTKWRRVFNAIADAGIVDLRSEWKHIDSDHITQHIKLPRHRDILERRFQDGYFQPYEYKWIEWIRFPFRYCDARMSLTRDQDLVTLESALVQSRALTRKDETAITLIAFDAPSAPQHGFSC